MTTIVISGPVSILTCDVARERIGLPSSMSDDTVSALVAAATALLDGPSGWLGRSLGLQTLEYRIDGIHCEHDLVRLPYPPIVSILSVTYIDALGAPIPVDPGSYNFDGDRTLWIKSGILGNASWRRDAVRIRFEAGYQPSSVPAPIIQAILMGVAEMQSMLRTDISLKQDTVMGVSSQSWETSADVAAIYERVAGALLAPYRVYD